MLMVTRVASNTSLEHTHTGNHLQIKKITAIISFHLVLPTMHATSLVKQVLLPFAALTVEPEIAEQDPRPLLKTKICKFQEIENVRACFLAMPRCLYHPTNRFDSHVTESARASRTSTAGFANSEDSERVPSSGVVAHNLGDTRYMISCTDVIPACRVFSLQWVCPTDHPAWAVRH